MSFRLEPELLQYFNRLSNHPPAQRTSLKDTQQQEHQEYNPDILKVEVATALADDPMLAFMLRLDRILSVRGNLITCLATIRRNVHHHELLYLQRFKQIAEPAVRYPRLKEQALLYLDPKILRCGQQVLLKIETRLAVTESPQLLREYAVLRATCDRDPQMFSRPYLFGCLGDEFWRVTSTDSQDVRQLVIHKRHFLLCQYTEDSLQQMVDCNRADSVGLRTGAACRLGWDMLARLRHLHGLGWAHNDLRPASFRFTPGDGDMLLGDFAAASPIRRDTVRDNAGNANLSTYRSARFPAPTSGMFADLESLVYILCALMSPSPLPWEAATDPESTVAMKLAVWQVAEAAADSSSCLEVWQAGRLDQLFNCAWQQAEGHLAFRLARAVSQLHGDWSASSQGTHALPDYTTLFDSLRDAVDKTFD